MDSEARIHALWQAVAAQDREALAGFFTEDAVVLWPNSGERFSLADYLRANCDYPGQWRGQVEQIGQDGGVSVTRVWDAEEHTFRVVSFYRWRGERIERMEEYWGDVGPAPDWRRELSVGRALRPGEAVLPAAVPMGRCGFFCGVCPDWRAGSCAGCREAHGPGDCFTRDCTERRGLDFCTLCGEFPCGALLERERATVLDREWLRWKKREIAEGAEHEGDNLPL